MAVKISWNMMKSFLWLLFAAVCLSLAFIVWIMSLKQPEFELIEPEKQAQEASRPVQVETVAFDSQLGGFSEEVPTLSLTQRVVIVGNRAPEFRGSKFISEQQKMWSLQVMKVTEEDIIKSYLDQREDRNKFQYFRLQVDQQPEQFILTYGVFKDVNEVLEKTKAINFDLPTQIKLQPEKFSSYAAAINDLGYDETSSGTKLRPISLTKVALPMIPVVRPEPRVARTYEDGVLSIETRRRESPSSEINADTTVTPKKPVESVPERKIAPVQPSNKPQNAEPQVADPF